jgi:hypothetical protein
MTLVVGEANLSTKAIIILAIWLAILRFQNSFKFLPH